jgi:hypothetical protein
VPRSTAYRDLDAIFVKETWKKLYVWSQKFINNHSSKIENFKTGAAG